MVSELDPMALDALKNRQRQLDADGCEVGVSRQALDELIAAYEGGATSQVSPANPAQVTEADSDLLSQCYIAMRDAMSVIDVNEGPGLKHSKILNALADARVKIERRTGRQPVAAISVATLSKPAKVTDAMVLAYKQAFQAHIDVALSPVGVEGAATMVFDATRAGLEAALTAAIGAGGQAVATWDIEATAEEIARSLSAVKGGRFHGPAYSAAKAGALEAFKRATSALSQSHPIDERAVEALREQIEAAREFVKRHPSLSLIDLAEFEAFLKIPAALAKEGR